MSFLYYYPGNGPIPDELRYAVKQDEPHHRRQVMRGPFGRAAGTIVAHESVDAALVRFDEAQQEWKPFPGDSQVCVGLPKASKLQPEQLVRDEALPGHWITLGDGSRWLIPVARGFDAESEYPYLALPIGLEYDCPTGRWLAGGVQIRYKRLHDIVERHLERRMKSSEENSDTFTDPEANDLAIEAIRTNYRVDSVELSFFKGAFTLQSRQDIIDAVIDLPTIIKWHKAKANIVTTETTETTEQPVG